MNSKMLRILSLFLLAGFYSKMTNAVFFSVEAFQDNLGIEITVPKTDRSAFFVPARDSSKEPVFAIIQPTFVDSTVQNADRASAIKIVPQVSNGKVKIAVSLLFGKMDRSDSVEAVKEMRSKEIVSYSASPGDATIIADLEKFGIKPVKIEVVSTR